MSLILDALNRSRDEVDPVPHLGTHHPVEPLSDRLPQYLPWLGLGIALLVILVLVVRLMGDSVVNEGEAVGAPVAALTQNIGSAANSVTNELKARAEARQASTAISATKPQPGTVAPLESTAARPAEPKPAGKTEIIVAEAPDPVIAKLYRDKDKLQAPAEQASVSTTSASNGSPSKKVSEEEVIDIETVLERAQQEMENANLIEHPAPFLTALSQRAKDEIPTIYYQKHDYSSDAGVSSVTLNGKAVKLGGSPLSGLKVDEILPDSVILTYRGTQFRLRALNSWVNL
ncbi:MAG: general secretion pathway protein GspB [Halieaceae bacterium]|nr:general secretion pathway protein GspB [Halieaceae bacterium]